MLKNAKTWVEINAQALSHNIKVLKSLLSPEATFCAVVKANAYGHDLETIVRLSLLEKIDCFGVDSLDEAILVRRRAPQATIIILGYTVPERFNEVVSGNFIQTVYLSETVEELAKVATQLQKQAKINIKIETGTNRQGIKIKKLDGLLREIRRRERSLQLEGLSSHFADAENVNDTTLSEQQLTNFSEAIQITHDLGFDPPLLHIACSAAAINDPRSHGTLARYGIALYGLWSSADLKKKNQVSQKAIELKPVLSWKTRIAQIKEVPSGSFVGYARNYRTDHPIRIAVLPVGYYDGYRRAFSNKGSVLINGQICKVLGTICMNMFMVDVSTVPNAKPGDTATLLGRDGMREISAEDLAEQTNTINYEIPTQINPLLPRIVV